MHSIYILKSQKDNELYYGYSANLKERIKEHSNGMVVATRYRRPLKLIYAELYITKKTQCTEKSILKAVGAEHILKKFCTTH